MAFIDKEMLEPQSLWGGGADRICRVSRGGRKWGCGGGASLRACLFLLFSEGGSLDLPDGARTPFQESKRASYPASLSLFSAQRIKPCALIPLGFNSNPCLELCCSAPASETSTSKEGSGTAMCVCVCV